MELCYYVVGFGELLELDWIVILVEETSHLVSIVLFFNVFTYSFTFKLIG